MAETFSIGFFLRTCRALLGGGQLAAYLCFFLSSSLLLPCPAQDLPKGIEAEQIVGLVARLGSSEFAARELATEQLSHSNEKLLPELEQALNGLTSDDLEARVRLSGIITRIKHDRNQNQIRVFLRSIDPTETQGFEGWKSFSRVSGTNRNAKMLFLLLLDTYPELVFAELTTKKEALDKARNIAASINERNMNLIGSELPDALSMLYCFNVADDLTDRSLERLSTRTFGTAPFSQFMSDPQSKKTLERLMSGWSKRIEEELPNCLMLFVEKDYPQAKEIALKMLGSDQIKRESFGFIRSMQAIYRFGSRADLPMVEKWLDDKTECINIPIQSFENQFAPQIVYTAEFRDIALLVSMHLSGEDFMTEFPRFQPHSLWGFREESVLLPPNSETARTNRIENWKAKRKISTKI